MDFNDDPKWEVENKLARAMEPYRKRLPELSNHNIVSYDVPVELLSFISELIRPLSITNFKYVRGLIGMLKDKDGVATIVASRDFLREDTHFDLHEIHYQITDGTLPYEAIAEVLRLHLMHNNIKVTAKSEDFGDYPLKLEFDYGPSNNP